MTVLERIAGDERNHAALAWRFVAWAINERPELRAVAEREFQRIASGTRPGARDNTSGRDLRRQGALTEAIRSELREAAIRDVVLPCAERLLAAPATPGRTAVNAFSA
jgi:hypothetical protein